MECPGKKAVRPRYMTDWDVFKKDFRAGRKTKNESIMSGFCLVDFDSF